MTGLGTLAQPDTPQGHHSSAVYELCGLGLLLNLSEPRLPHLQNKDNETMHPTGLGER